MQVYCRNVCDPILSYLIMLQAYGKVADMKVLDETTGTSERKPENEKDNSFLQNRSNRDDCKFA